jgi:hypothetical protein
VHTRNRTAACCATCMLARDQCCPPVARFVAADWGESWPSAAWALGQAGGRNHRKGWLASPCCVWRGLVRRLLVRGQHSCSCWLSAGESPRPAAHSSSSRKGKTDRRLAAPHPRCGYHSSSTDAGGNASHSREYKMTQVFHSRTRPRVEEARKYALMIAAANGNWLRDSICTFREIRGRVPADMSFPFIGYPECYPAVEHLVEAMEARKPPQTGTERRTPSRN